MPRQTRNPVVAVLYREALPPRLSEIEELAEVRLARADGLAGSIAGDQGDRVRVVD